MKKGRRWKKKGISLLLVLVVMMSFCVTMPETVQAEEETSADEQMPEENKEADVNETTEDPGDGTETVPEETEINGEEETQVQKSARGGCYIAPILRQRERWPEVGQVKTLIRLGRLRN